MIVKTGNKQDIRVELKSKKLKSGRCQVKFSTIDNETFYGYMIVEPATSVKDVVRMLQRRLENIESKDRFYHKHLYSLGKEQQHPRNIMVINN